MHYYPFHIGDFRSGTVNMSRQARWIYRDMMDIYYDTEQPLPLDLDQLFDMLGAESVDEKSIVERHLKFKFEKTDDGYRHEICDKTIAEYHAKAVTARENGKLGGRPKHSKNKPSGFPSGSNQVPSPNPDLTGSEANQEPITNNQEPLESKTLVAVPATADSLGDDQSGYAAPGYEETKKTSIKYSEVQAAYNEICGDVLSKCKVMNPKRKRLIVAAAAIDVDGFKPFREHGIEFWKAYFVECMKNPHWRGESKFGNNSSDWKADFDFLVRMDNVIKVLEKL